MFTIEVTRPYLRVFSSIFSNLCAGWIFSIFIARNPLVLTGNILGAIVSLYLAIKVENLLEEL